MRGKQRNSKCLQPETGRCSFICVTVIQFQVRVSFVVAHNASDAASNLDSLPVDFVFYSGRVLYIFNTIVLFPF